MRRSVGLLFTGVVTALVLASGVALAASPEDRDPSFDRDGRVVTDFSAPEEPRSANVMDAVVLPGGKIVAGGSAKAGNSRTFALARYDADGSLDESFDADGKVITDLPGQYDWLRALVAQSDGKVVAVGESDEPWMLRYDTDGSLDESFGVEGKVALHLPDRWDDVAYVADVTVQEDGKIVVAGTADDFERFALARYETDGSLDETFGGDGRVTGEFNGQGGVARAITIQPDGKILVSLYSYYGAVLHRLEADGTYDRSFGEAGTVENPDVPGYKDLVIQENGKIVALNYRDLARRMWGVTRYNRDGSVDRSMVFHCGWGGEEYPGARAMAMQPDGRIVLAGSLKGEDGLYDFALTRHLVAIFEYDKKKPTGSLTIDEGLASTEDRIVELTLEASDPEPNSSGVSRMRIKNSGGDWTRWSAYQPNKTWKLSRGAGTKRLYAQYKDVAGNVSEPASDAIVYRP